MINYENIKALIRFDGDKISVDTLLIKQGKGKLSATGEMAFDSTIFSGNMINSTLVVKAEKFDVIKSRKNRLQIDANTFIKSKGNKPEFGGEINVLQSTFYHYPNLARYSLGVAPNNFFTYRVKNDRLLNSISSAISEILRRLLCSKMMMRSWA